MGGVRGVGKGWVECGKRWGSWCGLRAGVWARGCGPAGVRARLGVWACKRAHTRRSRAMRAVSGRDGKIAGDRHCRVRCASHPPLRWPWAQVLKQAARPPAGRARPPAVRTARAAARAAGPRCQAPAAGRGGGATPPAPVAAAGGRRAAGAGAAARGAGARRHPPAASRRAPTPAGTPRLLTVGRRRPPAPAGR
jgi:hypothetical protein